MTKKIISVILSLFLISSLFGVQNNTQSSKNSKTVITGYVISKGNVPFVYPVIRTEDGTEYTIDCKDRVKQKLLNSQGYPIKFTGTIENGVFILKKWKVLK